MSSPSTGTSTDWDDYEPPSDEDDDDDDEDPAEIMKEICTTLPIAAQRRLVDALRKYQEEEYSVGVFACQLVESLGKRKQMASKLAFVVPVVDIDMFRGILKVHGVH